GEGAARAFALALRDAGIEAKDVDYINAHGTSTDMNDPMETKAIKRTFGEHAYNVAISSTKSMTGHMLGAAGAVELMVAVLACKNDIIPPTINYTTPDPECDLDYVPNTCRSRTVRVAVSDSLGFGGHNAVLVVRKFEQ
ncbi:MAG TPA: beta-ketoacyl-[acyl-carrier-protein] synthase II, partial [Syntrophothermus lipocalidus]|nr:beta-ketoacyl-[acyl-carrier-protein] synthase II [Syntrophothermus lipocalidus]